jgi:polysaccharide biosynthesis protein PslH
MNILIITPFLPYPLDQGGKIRIFNLIQHLSRKHTITLACLSPAMMPDYGPLSDLCDEIIVITRNESFMRDFARFILAGKAFNCARFYSRTFAERLSNLSARKNFDLVQIEFSLLWQYALLFPDLPVTLDSHNIEYKNVQQIGEASKGLLKRWLYRLEVKRLRSIEERAWQEGAVCFAVSDQERDKITLGAGGQPRIITAANGVDPDRFAFRARGKAEKKILFLGGMDYTPNLDAARYFLGEVFPMIQRAAPEARLLLVGRELGKLGDLTLLPGVECHESVPEVLPWFYEANLLAVPLRQGAGTRIKVLEAMAAGLPVVTTSKGCEGIRAENGRQLLVADTPDEFAAAALRIMHYPEVGRDLAKKARQLVVEHYTWENAALIMDQSYQQLHERIK